MTPEQTCKNPKLNTVQTVLSERAANHLECILYWFYDEFDPDCLTKDLLKMLEIYIKTNPDDVHPTQKPSAMADRVSRMLQLSEQLKEILEMKKPWEWIETRTGWELPVTESE